MKEFKNIIIAIDGSSACGKSTTAKKIAQALGMVYVDTGAMYRAVTLYFLRNGVHCDQEEEVLTALSEIDISFRFEEHTADQITLLNGENVEQQIRGLEVSNSVSEVAAVKAVRVALVEQQRKMGRNRGLVMDGRDIGTHVFPDAELKLFMTADFNVRAARRKIELDREGREVALEDIRANLAHRDNIDSTRKENPLSKAADAIEIDTTHLTFEEQIAKIIDLAHEII